MSTSRLVWPVSLSVILLSIVLIAACGSQSQPKKTETNSRPEISGAWVRSTIEGQDVSAAYMTIAGQNDVLLGVSVPSDIAGSAEIHRSMAMSGDSTPTQRAVSKDEMTNNDGSSSGASAGSMNNDSSSKSGDSSDGKQSLPNQSPGNGGSGTPIQTSPPNSGQPPQPPPMPSDKSGNRKMPPQENSKTSSGQGMIGMKPVTGIPVNGVVELKPGGYHIMFLNLRKPLTVGSVVPISLQFKRAGSVNVDAEVR